LCISLVCVVYHNAWCKKRKILRFFYYPKMSTYSTDRVTETHSPYLKVSPLYSNIHTTRCKFTQFILSGNCSTCFGWYHHPSSGAQTTVSTASGICHTVIAICRNRGRVGTGLNVLWVVYATHSCRYSCLRSWWWVMVPLETCRAISR
jgi:hypothetical protein